MQNFMPGNGTNWLWYPQGAFLDEDPKTFQVRKTISETAIRLFLKLVFYYDFRIRNKEVSGV